MNNGYPPARAALSGARAATLTLGSASALEATIMNSIARLAAAPTVVPSPAILLRAVPFAAPLALGYLAYQNRDYLYYLYRTIERIYDVRWVRMDPTYFPRASTKLIGPRVYAGTGAFHRDALALKTDPLWDKTKTIGGNTYFEVRMSVSYLDYWKFDTVDAWKRTGSGHPVPELDITTPVISTETNVYIGGNTSGIISRPPYIPPLVALPFDLSDVKPFIPWKYHTRATDLFDRIYPDPFFEKTKGYDLDKDGLPPPPTIVKQNDNVNFVSKAKVWTHTNTPPKENQREKKARATGRGARLLSMLMQTTEINDVLDIMYDNITTAPDHAIPMADKIRFIFTNLDHLDMNQFTHDLIVNQFEDAVVGKIMGDISLARQIAGINTSLNLAETANQHYAEFERIRKAQGKD